MSTAMILGFTGTQHGMTQAQIETVGSILMAVEAKEIHLGDCIGADDEARKIAIRVELRTVGHPPHNSTKRAFGKFDEIHPTKGYLERNRDIVNACDVLIATPKESTKQHRGGTWYTIGYAKSMGKKLMIVLPDGKVTNEIPN